EEQFYLAWPCFVMLAFGLWRRRSMPIGRDRLLKWMVAGAVTSFVLSVYLTDRRQPWAFYSSPARAWELALGGLGVLVRPGKLLSSIPAAMGWLGFSGVLLAGLLFDDHTHFPGLA